jgi:Spy/CpxP family protein refolding chaperone
VNGTRGVVIATAAAFIVGCAVGLMGGILFARLMLPGPRMFMRMHGGEPRFFGPGPGRPGAGDRLLPMLDETLRLTPQQHERIVGILDRARHSNAAIRDSMEEEISRTLTPEQRAQWKEMEERFERSRHGPGRRISWPPDGNELPGPGERDNSMRSNVWSLSLAALLASAPTVAVAQAEEAPPPRSAEIAPGHNPAIEEDGDFDFDLLAADLPPGGDRDDATGPGAMRRPGGGTGMMGHGGPGMMGRGGPGGMGALREQLNLTDEQKNRLADIRDRHERTVIPIQGELRLASLDLRKLMRADRPDSRAINAQIDKLAGLRASMQKSRVAGMLEARAVLTPAQQKLLREHRGAMMGRGMGGPGRHRMQMGGME